MNIVQTLVQGGSDPGLVEVLSCDSPIEIALESKQHRIVDYLNTVLPSTCGRVLSDSVVTGGNRGIGRAISKQILAQGHRVVFTCRDAEVAEAVASELLQETGNDKISFVIGNLNTVQETFDVASKVAKDFAEIDRLILNAGMWPTKKVANADGLEEGFVVNYMAQYILCDTLLPQLTANGPSRIVFIGAGLHKIGRADLESTPTGKDFPIFRTYADTKQCQAVLMLYLSRHVDPEKVTVNAVHSGVVDTGLGETSWWTANSLLRPVKRLWMSTEDGSIAPCWVAHDPNNTSVNGVFFNIQNPVKLKLEGDEQTQSMWVQWTKDFLARTNGAPLGSR